MSREPLPSRRYSESFDLMHNGICYAVQVGFYPDGRPGEVFMGMAKAAGTGMDVEARDIAILISLLLQHGATPATIAHALTRRADGGAEGLAGTVLAALMEGEREAAA
jgi:hypothetical protein